MCSFLKENCAELMSQENICSFNLTAMGVCYVYDSCPAQNEVDLLQRWKKNFSKLYYHASCSYGVSLRPFSPNGGSARQRRFERKQQRRELQSPKGNAFSRKIIPCVNSICWGSFQCIGVPGCCTL